MVGHPSHHRLMRILAVATLIVAGLGLHGAVLAAQRALTAVEQDLRSRIERNYEALPLRDGLLLKSKSGQPPRSIEVSNSRISINGVDVTGAELRQQLGDDADLVLQLSYLDPPAQRALFGFDAPSSAPVIQQQSPSTPDSQRQRRLRRSGAQIRFGGDVTIGPDEVANDDVVVFGGTAHIDGQVNGDVLVFGGRIELGPKAVVRGDVTAVGGVLERDPAATITGDVNEVGVASRLFDGMPARRGFFRRMWPMTPFVSFAGTSLRAALLMFFACGMVLFVRKPIERIGDQAAAEPLKAGAVGVLAELLFFPTLIALVVLLVITIVGIPLLALVPFAMLALIIVLLMGFTAVAYRLGERVAARFGWTGGGPYLWTIAGIVIVLAPLLLARLIGIATGGFAIFTLPLVVLGVLVEYVAWTVGFGAAVLARFRPAAPPPATPAPLTI